MKKESGTVILIAIILAILITLFFGFKWVVLIALCIEVCDISIRVKKLESAREESKADKEKRSEKK